MEEQLKLIMQVNAQQRTQIEQLNALLQFQIEQNQALTAKIDELLQRIDELSHKKNSRNNGVSTKYLNRYLAMFVALEQAGRSLFHPDVDAVRTMLAHVNTALPI